MPLYEYQCVLCDHTEEVLQKMDGPSPICPKCTERTADAPPRITSVMVKQISRSSFALKGEGWFKDHYGLKSTAVPEQE